MAGSVIEEFGAGRSLEGASCGQQQCQYGEALAEWRSSEQVENGIASTSPPYWDSNDDDDGGPKPSELYGKYTWKIDKFSQINKRELRSNAFEVGGYKWYILIYPQGCDVCNHLSLFLCVANHDKLLPGWKHFAQFTIAVVNKDPKKSKYSDTLHRFWKKEHDWGWKKFMELSKVLDGFIDADTLIIKAQVQVIREREDRPFRCLDCQYRRELVRVYLTNVEQICRRFVEERRGKLGKLIEDKARWSSFRAFWLGMEQSAKRRMSREKTDAILKSVVKHFFIEKEVTSTLVMDSLYSGLKALEGHAKCKKGKGKYLEAEELPASIICMEKDTFVLVDDVLVLLERVAMEPLPPKDEKVLQNRTKDGSSGEDFNKDSIERDEKRLTELGRRTIEIFVLAQIFSSKVEVAYQEAVALKKQEELIREEEAAWMAGSEQKAKRGAAEKEKKAKKKQGKLKRNNHKSKDKGRDDKSNFDNGEQESLIGERKDYLTEESEAVNEKTDAPEDVSDTSDSVDCISEILQPDTEGRDTSTLNWDTDTLDVHPPPAASTNGASALSAVQNGVVGRSPLMDDSSSTCSTHSVPSALKNGPYKGDHKTQRSPMRGRNQRGKATCVTSSLANGTRNGSFETFSDVGKLNDASGSGKMLESGPQATTVISSKNRMKNQEEHFAEEAEVPKLLKPNAKHDTDDNRPAVEKCAPPSRSPLKDISPVTQLKLELNNTSATEPPPARRPTSDIYRETNESAPFINSSETIAISNRSTTSKPSERPSEPQVHVTNEKPSTQQVPVRIEQQSIQQVPAATEKPSMELVPIMSRSSSAPLAPGPRPTAPAVSMVQTAPLLSRSASAAGRLDPGPSSASHSYIPQSYRNVMLGNPIVGSSNVMNSSHSYSQLPIPVSAPFLLPQSSERKGSNSIKPSFSFGMLNYDKLQNGLQWTDCPPRDGGRNVLSNHPSLLNEVGNFEMYNPVHSRSQVHMPPDFQAGTSGRQINSTVTDEFPHLDIINDLLDDEYGIGKVTVASASSHSSHSGPQHLNRQLSFAGEMRMSNDLGVSSSCRFERARSYHEDRHQHGYGFPRGQFDMMDVIPNSTLRPYANGQIDGLVPNQWQKPGSDLYFRSMRSTENDGHLYHMQDYSNFACSVNGYSVFRPSSGL